MGIPTKENKKINKAYNNLGDASHYDKERLNTIIKMEAIWGTVALMYHCEITAFKYRERAGKKEDQSLEQEILKAEWYEKAASYFLGKIEKGDDIISCSDNLPLKMKLPWKK